MKYKVSVIKKIAFLVMTMALAVAMVACSGAVGKQGPPGPAGPAGDTPTEPTTPTTPTEPTTPTTPTEPTTPTTPTENMGPETSALLPQTLSAMTGDDPLVVDVAPFFTDADGDELTFRDAASSDLMVATVVLSDSTLTITFVAAGPSTISVVATDPGDLSVTGSIMLTVSDPAPDPDPTTTIHPAISLAMRDLDTDGDDTADVFPTYEQAFVEGYTLQTSDSSVVNVVRTGATDSGNEWRLTARAKGSATVYVNDENNVEAARITVTVVNSPPLRNAKQASRALLDLEMVNVVDIYPNTDLYIPVVTHRIVYRTLADAAGLGDLREFYTDADGDSLSFVAEVQDPHEGLILFKTSSRSYDNDSSKPAEPVLYEVPADAPTHHVIYADILTERVDRPIGVKIYAFDGDDKSADVVDFEIRNKKPIPRDGTEGSVEGPHAGNPAYLLTQLQEPGFFRNEKYGNRTGVDHIFKFGHATKMVGTAQVLGFTFAHDFLEKLVEDGFSIGLDADLGADDHLFSVDGTSSDISPTGRVRLKSYDAAALGAIYYDFAVGGPITQSGDDAPGIANFVQGSAETGQAGELNGTDGNETYPEIKFRFNSDGTGMLTVTFGVWADEDGTGPKTPGWQTESRRVDFEIIGCTSVDKIEDCP